MTEGQPRILMGIDGSEDGLRAARYGIGRALRRGGDLWFVNAVDDGVISGGWGIVYDPMVLKEAGAAAIGQARDLAQAEGIAPERIVSDVIIGNPSAVLARCSKQADLMIVGRRATSGLERMFVGSTSTSLVTAAGCPMIVISAASTPETTGAFRKITVAVGGAGDHALRWACQEAVAREVPVEVVHVVPYQPTSLVSFLPSALTQERDWDERVRAGLEELVTPVRRDFPGVELRLRSERGVLAEELIQESAQTDLLVVGLRPRPMIMPPGPLRAVLAHAACPVALIGR